MESSIQPIRPNVRRHCYLCGSSHDLTDDHIPPEGFFPPGQRARLLTAPLCRSCHQALSQMDEKMRFWLSAGGGKSNAGKWIWKNKVMGSTFKRSPKLAAHIREKHFRPILDQRGFLLGGEITIPQGCPVPFIRRLTKGILYLLHPDYDYFPDFFHVNYEPPTPTAVAVVSELASHLPRVDKGDGVYRLWHGITDTGTSGVCVHLFYDAVCFVCFFGKDMQFKQQFRDGYSEEPGLPKFL